MLRPTLYPARFTLVAAMNPCPCGYRGSAAHPERCTCDPTLVARYLRRISGPLFDRIDLGVALPAVEQYGFSPRGYHRVLRVARTIADLAGEERIGAEPVAEAVGYGVRAGREGEG